MDEILKYIIQYCSFLYKDKEFNFIDSAVSSSFGGDAYLILSDKMLNLRFLSDRGQLFLEFQSHSDDCWYSIDLIRHLLRPEEKKYYSLLNEENAVFLKQYFFEIKDCFSDKEYNITKSKLKVIMSKRAKYLFG